MVESIKTGEPKGYEEMDGGNSRPKTESEQRCEHLTLALARATEDNTILNGRIAELEARMLELVGTPKLAKSNTSKSLDQAKTLDGAING